MIWTSSFMKDKHITLTIDDDTTFMSRINADISQDSSIFFILYLFYNANILKSLKRSRYRIIVIEFVNDINILTYETSTKNNCRALKKTHVECELWAKRHETRFASIKYELMHLTRNHRRFNMTTIININEVIKKSFISMKVLKMQLDIKFKWDSHVKKIMKKWQRKRSRSHVSLHRREKSALRKRDTCTQQSSDRSSHTNSARDTHRTNVRTRSWNSSKISLICKSKIYALFATHSRRLFISF
jgi:hypothetical protein